MFDADFALRIVGMRLKDRALIGPETVQVDLTDDCLNNCIGCWARSPFLRDDDHYDTLDRGTLEAGFVMELLSQLAAMNVRTIFLGGGGDPLCHDEFVSVVRRVKQLGMNCVVNTNLLGADETMLRELVAVGLDELIVSLWAADAPMYSRLHPNQSEGSFRLLEGKLRALRDMKGGAGKAPPRIKIYNVICSVNAEQLPQMIEHGRLMDVESVEFSILDPIPERTQSFLPSADQVERIRDFFEHYRQQEPPFVHHELFLRRLMSVDAHKGVFDNTFVESVPCATGWFYARVTTVGQVHSCLKAHRIPVGELKQYGFSEIWYGGGQNKFRENTVKLRYDNPFLTMTGHVSNPELPGCYRICDNLGTNALIQQKLENLSESESACLDEMEKEARQGASVERLRQIHAHCAANASAGQTGEGGGPLEIRADHPVVFQQMGLEPNVEQLLDRLAALAPAQPIRIPVSIENLARLPKILALIRQRTGRPVEAKDTVFAFSPLRGASERLAPFLDRVKARLAPFYVRLEPDLPSMEGVLQRFEKGLSQHSEPDLLRALGVVCNAPLIGPRTFHLDVANTCNSDCVYCWFHSPFSADRPDADRFDAAWRAQVMPWEMFTDLVEDLRAVGCTEDVVLSGKGEPLVHPRIADMIAHLKAAGIFTTLFTNGLLLDERIARASIENGLDLLYVSLSAATQETYEQLQTKPASGSYKKILQNIRRLIDLRNDLGNRLPRVVMVDVLCNRNVEEVEAFAAMAADLGADLLRYQLAAIEPYNRSLALDARQLAALPEAVARARATAKKAGMEVVANIQDQLQGEGINWSEERYLRTGCLAGWSFARTWADGTLSFCCSPKPIGSLQRARFATWWNGPQYDHYRLAAKRIWSNRALAFADGTPLWNDICTRCPNYEGIGHLEGILEDLGGR